MPDSTRVLIAKCTEVGRKEILSMEKLSPILAYYEVNGWMEGCHRCIELLEFGGIGHSMVIHSGDKDIIMKFALEKPAFRILVNTPSSVGAVGYSTALMPSLTLGPGTWGGSIISENVTAVHLINIKTLAFETAPINSGVSINAFSGTTSGVSSDDNFMAMIEDRLKARAGNPVFDPFKKSNGNKISSASDTKVLGENISEDEINKIIREFKFK